MTLAYLLSEDRSQIVLTADARCGEDFCDQCGDCLHCYIDDPCYHSTTGEHVWVVYADQVEAWRAEHPEATEDLP